MVLALAALTNVALALHLDPKLPEKLARRGWGAGHGCVEVPAVNPLQTLAAAAAL